MDSLVATRSQIAEHFSDAVAADDALVQECASMCNMYNLSVEELSYKWQALSYSTTSTLAVFSAHSVPDLKARLQQELGRQTAAALRAAAGPAFGRGRVRGRGPTGAVGLGAGAGPGLDAGLKIGPLPPRTTGFIKLEGQAPYAGPSKVVFAWSGSDETSRSGRAYRYMYEKVTGRSEELDDRIDEFAALVQKHYGVDEFADPNAASEEMTTVVGRIVHDAEVSASGAKLNETSLVLESSRMMGSGVRVPIRFAPDAKLRGAIKGVGGVSFFPGAMVALRGRNGGGNSYVVEEILSLPSLKMPPSPPSDANAAFSMCIACGPFSSDSDLEYKPWAGLLDKVKGNTPAVVLLIGPFVDAANSCIKDGDLNETPKQLFDRQFTEKLQDLLLQSLGSTILLVPSINDVISNHAVYPQCELEPEFSNDPRIRLLPNPCRFSLNGISFAVTSVDTLFHVRKEEYFRRTPEVDPIISTSEPATDSMSNLARNIFQQRRQVDSFYPIFPVPLEVAHEVNLDVTHSEGAKLVENEEECAPDVLVLPSRLKQFAKVVDSAMVVNPSYLSKGTYATLSYAGQGTGLAKDRMAAEIARIS